MPVADPASELIALERAALERWGRGDPGGFIELAADDIAYFDPFVGARLDGREAFVDLMESIRGQVKIDRFEILAPRLHASDGLAVLTFNFVSWAGANENRWNATEAYRREPAGWRLVHQHWSLTRPRLQA